MAAWSFTPYAVPAACGALVGLLMLPVAWRRRGAPGGRAFAVLVAAVVVWSACEALVLCAPDAGAKLLVSRLQYLGIVVVPVAWLEFAIDYCGLRRRLGGGLSRALWLLPGAVGAWMLAGDPGGWIYQSVRLEPHGDFVAFVVDHGRLFEVFAVYSYLLIGAATLFFLWTLGGSRGAFGRQMLAVIVAPLLSLIGNALYLARWTPALPIDLTPPGFALGLLLLGTSLLRHRLFDLVPLARDAVVTGMPDGIIVADPRGRVLEVNPAMRRVLGAESGELVGRPLGEVIPAALVSALAAARGGQPREISLAVGGRERTYDLLVSRVASHGGSLEAELLVLRDVTERKATELELERAREELRRANRELERLASTDPLTLLPNRRAFLDRLATELARARRRDERLSLAMLDLDHFKRVNDSRGHAAGDEMLRAVGRLLAESVREIDLAARLGGEEFALLLPATPVADAREAVERVRERFNALGLVAGDSRRTRITVSCGIAEWDASAGGADDLLAAADRALYRAKSQGRDRVVVSEPADARREASDAPIRE
jgi:diguanylate cyclase (GGDEF)-like protein/PAS domain S-box-containing protein